MRSRRGFSGVNLGDGAVLGLASVATRDLEPWIIYAGVPATRVRERKRLFPGQETQAETSEC